MSVQEPSLSRIFPSLPRTTRGAPVVLGHSPAGDKIQYCNGNVVFTIPLESRHSAEIYTDHSHPTTVAKMSPSGFYCASGDVKGNVRIWDTTQSTNILKTTVAVFAGAVKDIAWDSESKRIAVVGDGKERFGHVFLLDTSTSVGNITGQHRQINSVDIRPIRPMRMITGSDDSTVAYFEGPPFSYKTTFPFHKSFVYSTRFSPDGSLFATAGSDGTIVLYDAKITFSKGSPDQSGNFKIGILEDTKGVAHSGTIFGIAWSPDGSKIASASADRTVKIWNVSSRKLEKIINFGQAIEHQQLGIVWTKTALISVSLNGFLSTLCPEQGIITENRRGHNKSITVMTKSKDGRKLYTADAEGHISSWIVETGESSRCSPHKTKITGIQVSDDGKMFSVGFDDVLIIRNSESSKESDSFKLPSQPSGLAVNEGLAVISCHQHIALFKNGKFIQQIPAEYQATCVAICPAPGNKFVAIGGNDSKVHLYKMNGDGQLEEYKLINQTAPITSVSFSDNREFLAVTCRFVSVFVVEKDFSPISESRWNFHSAKVLCSAWSPDNSRLATGSIDTSVCIWDVRKPKEDPIIIKAAHSMSDVNAVTWLNDTTLVSAGQDSNVKFWNAPC